MLCSERTAAGPIGQIEHAPAESTAEAVMENPSPIRPDVGGARRPVRCIASKRPSLGERQVRYRRPSIEPSAGCWRPSVTSTRADQVGTRALLLAVDQAIGVSTARPREGRSFRRSHGPHRGRSRTPGLTITPLSRAARNARRPKAPALLLGAEQERPDVPAKARTVHARRTSGTTG